MHFGLDTAEVLRIIIQGQSSPDVIGTTTASNQKNKMLPATNLSRTGAVPSTQFAGFALGEEPVELVVRSLDIGESAVQRAAECLSPGERARADRFAFQRDRKRFVAARAGLRGLLASRLGCLPEAVEIVTGIHGKPALSGRHGSDLRFNVSHCGDLVVYALAHGREVGVNVEALREDFDGDEIAARCFTAAEYSELRALPQAMRPLGFFNGWTRKEAFVKALALGLDCPLTLFQVSLAPGRPAQPAAGRSRRSAALTGGGCSPLNQRRVTSALSSSSLSLRTPRR